MGLTHDRNDCNARGSAYGFPLQNRHQFVFVGLGERCQNFDNLRHPVKLILPSYVLLQPGQVDLLAAIVRDYDGVDDFRNGFYCESMLISSR